MAGCPAFFKSGPLILNRARRFKKPNFFCNFVSEYISYAGYGVYIAIT